MSSKSCYRVLIAGGGTGNSGANHAEQGDVEKITGQRLGPFEHVCVCFLFVGHGGAGSIEIFTDQTNNLTLDTPGILRIDIRIRRVFSFEIPQ